MKHAVVLLSGGVDSVTCLALAKSLGFNCHTITFYYGQRHQAELQAAAKLSKLLNADSHHVINIDLAQFGHSALTDKNIAVPDYKGDGQIPITYVPARNTIFLSFALALAEVKQADTLFIGVSAVDYSGYPDCRPEYIKAFQNMANLATQAAVAGNPITIQTPIILLSKAETIRLGTSLGVDYSHTISCYQADDEGKACGTCDSCVLRKQGFTAAGITDPTKYFS